MSPSVERNLREMAALASPTDAEVEELLRGWTRLFAALQLTTDADQDREFARIIRARVSVGEISVLAPFEKSLR